MSTPKKQVLGAADGLAGFGALLQALPKGSAPREYLVKTCAGSLEGNPPWGPATEQRFPVIDAERGIVFGVTLLHYPKLEDQPRMYVSEVFKVVSGRIVRIDNIGLMLQGVEQRGALAGCGPSRRGSNRGSVIE